MRTIPSLTLLAIVTASSACLSQTPGAPSPIQRVTGTDPTSQIVYALISTPGTLIGAPHPPHHPA